MMKQQNQQQPATTPPPSQPPAKNKPSLRDFFEREDVKQKFKELLGKRSVQFITSVLQIAASSDMLRNADHASIYQSAMVAATLDLPLNNNLGFAYIVPYNVRQQDKSYKVVAQFQMGYKGYIQLAQRSGQFKSIYAAPIYEGQIISEDPLDGYQFDFSRKTSENIVGYASKFKLLNGFEAVWYMSIEQLNEHAKSYSQTYSSSKDYVRDKSLWNTNFNAMATKTVLKLLLSKFAPLSVEMQRAIIVDQAVIKDNETLDVDYVDNSKEQFQVDKEAERVALLIEDAQTIEDLMSVKDIMHQFPDLSEAYENKFSFLAEMQAE